MKSYAPITDRKDLVTREYVDNSISDAVHDVVWRENPDEFEPVGSEIKPVYVDISGAVQECDHTLESDVPSDAEFTDTKNTVGTTVRPNATLQIVGVPSGVVRSYDSYESYGIENARIEELYTSLTGEDGGIVTLTLGNSTANTSDGARGRVSLYNSGTTHQDIIPNDNSTANNTIILPATGGTLALTSDIPTLAPVATSGSYQDLTDTPTIPTDYAVRKTLSNVDLNTVVTPGLYDAGGNNNCTNIPNEVGTSGFSLVVTHQAAGNYYLQSLRRSSATQAINSAEFIRKCTNGTWSQWQKQGTVAVIGTNGGGTGWYKVADGEPLASSDNNFVFLVRAGWTQEYLGIIDINIHRGSTATVVQACKWIYRDGFEEDSIRIVIDGYKWTMYVYNPSATYGRVVFTCLSQGEHNGAIPNNAITFYNSTAKESTEPSSTNHSVDSDLHVANGTITGTLDLTRVADASGTADNKPALRIGNINGGHLEFDGNEIMAKATPTTTGVLYLNNEGSGVYINAGCDSRMVLQLGKIDVGTKNEEGTYVAGALKLNSNGGEVYVNNELVATQPFVNSKDSIAVPKTAFEGDLDSTPTEDYQIKSYLIPSTTTGQAKISNLPADYPKNAGVLIEYRIDNARKIQILYSTLLAGRWYIRSKKSSTDGWGEWQSSADNRPSFVTGTLAASPAAGSAVVDVPAGVKFGVIRATEVRGYGGEVLINFANTGSSYVFYTGGTTTSTSGTRVKTSYDSTTRKLTIAKEIGSYAVNYLITYYRGE